MGVHANQTSPLARYLRAVGQDRGGEDTIVSRDVVMACIESNAVAHGTDNLVIVDIDVSRCVLDRVVDSSFCP